MEIELLSRFVLIFSSLFVIVEPFGAVPSFLSLTKNQSALEVHRTALKASVFGALALVFFSVFGIWIFKFLQINLNSLKAAGGILLFLTALDMLRAKNKSCQKCSKDEMDSGIEREDVSIVPIAIPMLAGPGAMTSVMVFSTDHQSHHLYHLVILCIAIILTFLISYFVLRSSSFVRKVLGTSGISVMERVMGLFLGAISLQFFVEGATPLVQMVLSR